jgi:CRP-like cAMP-binding protein
MILKIKSNLEYFSPFFADVLFSATTSESAAALACVKHTTEFPGGGRLFSVGELPRNIYRFIKGRARLQLNPESKEINISRLVEPNEILGFTEAILDLPYQTNASAITSCICECITREDLLEFLHREPEICFRLARRLAENLQNNSKVFSYQ